MRNRAYHSQGRATREDDAGRAIVSSLKLGMGRQTTRQNARERVENRYSLGYSQLGPSQGSVSDSYLADDWEVFLSELRDKENANDAEDHLRDIIDRVLRRLGLRVEDVDERMFVGVGEPVFCRPANERSL